LSLADKPTAWRSTNTIQVFAYGAQFGLKMAGFILVIFGSMLFAGEFDRGTIKILLTRPITRTDLFAAKCLTGFLLALLLLVSVLSLSFAMGCAMGDLGPVWDRSDYLHSVTYDDLVDHALKAVQVAIPGIIAAVFLGLVVSCVTDTSGYAVAMALTIFIGADLGLALFSDGARYFFNYYPEYAFKVLQAYSEGTSTRWQLPQGQFWIIPAASAAICTGASYVIFRFRNILA